MDEAFREWEAWRETTRDEPLEGMGTFFDARVEAYEAHMARWEAHYRWMARLLPDGVRTLLDLGCGTGLELDRIFERFPDLAVTGVDLSPDMLGRLARKHAGKGSRCFARTISPAIWATAASTRPFPLKRCITGPPRGKQSCLGSSVGRSSPAGVICNATT